MREKKNNNNKIRNNISYLESTNLGRKENILIIRTIKIINNINPEHLIFLIIPRVEKT